MVAPGPPRQLAALAPHQAVVMEALHPLAVLVRHQRGLGAARLAAWASRPLEETVAPHQRAALAASAQHPVAVGELALRRRPPQVWAAAQRHQRLGGRAVAPVASPLCQAATLAALPRRQVVTQAALQRCQAVWPALSRRQVQWLAPLSRRQVAVASSPLCQCHSAEVAVARQSERRREQQRTPVRRL